MPAVWHDGGVMDDRFVIDNSYEFVTIENNLLDTLILFIFKDDL